MNSNLLDSCLQVLYKEFPQVVQRLQLLGYGLLQTLEILACLLATVHLQWQFRQSWWLLHLVGLQSLIVRFQLLLSQRQCLVQPTVDKLETCAVILTCRPMLFTHVWFSLWDDTTAYTVTLHTHTHAHTHTQTHPFNGPFSRTTRVSQYQKGKTNLDFTEARDREWQWHQLGHMQVCISLQTNNHASTPPVKFFTGRMPFLPPNQQHLSTEGTVTLHYIKTVYSGLSKKTSRSTKVRELLQNSVQV